VRARIDQIEALAGKTIEQCVARDPQILITFTDNTYAAFTTGIDCSEAPELGRANMDVRQEIITLAAMGIINQEEKLQWFREREITDAIRQRAQDRQDRLEYERLKKKFEP
jgi:hypothetical protein